MTRPLSRALMASPAALAVMLTAAAAQAPAPQQGAAPAASAAATPGAGLTASGLRSQPVYNTGGQEIGRVNAVVIGPDNQAYAVLAGGLFGDRQVLLPANRLNYQNNRFVAGGYTDEQLRALPAYTAGAAGYRDAEDTYALAITGYTTAQAGQPGTNIVVQQPAPTIRVDQAPPQVTVQQAQPQVSVRQPVPEILVRQPAPVVTVEIPHPEITVRMPRPDVDVALAQPQVQVTQPQPQVQVVQPGQPQVQVQPAQPQVQVQAPASPDANVQVQQGEPQVRYERAEPRVVVNQAQGQPQVRVEQADQTQGQQTAAAAAAQPAAPATQPAAPAAPPATTGATAQPAGNLRPVAVSRLLDMNLYNARGEQLGDVERVVAGTDNQPQLIIGHGGFLGLGEKQVAIPLDRVAVRGDRLVLQSLTDDQIKAMPAWDRNTRGVRDLEGSQQIQLSTLQ